MIYLHKILPVLFLPLSIVIYLLMWGVIKKRRTPIILAIIILMVTSLPISHRALIRYVENYTVRKTPSETQHADAVVVLSGMLTTVNSAHGLVSEWDPYGGGVNRFFAGIELMQAKKANYLIFTGGKLPWQPNSPLEGEVLAKHAQNFGIRKNRILVTGEVQTTFDEAKAVKEMVNSKGLHRIILVTSAFHMPRAKLLFEKCGVNVEPYPVDFRVQVEDTTLIDFLPTGRCFGRFEFAWRELVGYWYYLLKSKLWS